MVWIKRRCSGGEKQMQPCKGVDALSESVEAQCPCVVWKFGGWDTGLETVLVTLPWFKLKGSVHFFQRKISYEVIRGGGSIHLSALLMSGVSTIDSWILKSNG
ncbi:hypothetical protein TNCV_2423101 [Trichonephila clavipes]|nr:hypothetical protein TNCV_2423101 [Trichonephila clavipes]